METFKSKSIRPFILSVFTGFLLILVFPRFDIEFIAWFAFLPLFFAIEGQSPGRAALYGFVAGMVFYFFGLHWVTNTLTNYGNISTPLSYLLLALLAAYLSFYFSVFCCLVRILSRNNSLYFFLLCPVVWTSLEYLRSTHGDYGFSWLGLGYSQYLSLPVIQAAEFTGVYGISALVMLLNAAFHFCLKAWFSEYPQEGKRETAVRVAGLTALVLLLWLGYGFSALNRDANNRDESNALLIALAQGNIEQNLKWKPFYRKQVIKKYRDLTLQAAESSPDLVVWPEAATPFYVSVDKRHTRRLMDLVRETQTHLLVGSPYTETRQQGDLIFNSAFLVSPQGTLIDRYDKIHLVPFGEFVPFRNLLFFVEKLVEMIGDFGKGNLPKVFSLPGGKFGVSICYEITFPDLVRRPVKEGAGFLVNITNDAWFGDSAASYQHFAMAALRAVENRVPIVRAANTGISGTVDPNGTLRQTTKLFVEDLVLTKIVPYEGPRTYYSRHGDVFSLVCLITWVILSGLAWRTRSSTDKES